MKKLIWGLIFLLSILCVNAFETELVNVTDCANNITITLVNSTMQVDPGEYLLKPCTVYAPNVWRCNCSQVMLVTQPNTINKYTFNISAMLYNYSEEINEYSENNTITTNYSTLVIDNTSSTINSTIIVPITTEEVKLDFSSLITTTNGSNEINMVGQINAEINTTDGIIEILFPSNITIVGSSSWDGTITLPTITVSDSVNTTADSGYSLKSTDLVITVGNDNENLTFDKAVMILFPGMKDKSAGFQIGEIFTPIKTKCNGVNDWSNIVGNKECYINSGNDLLIWTKHFTEYIAYTQEKIPCTGCACTDSCGRHSSDSVILGNKSSNSNVTINNTIVKNNTVIIEKNITIEPPINKPSIIIVDKNISVLNNSTTFNNSITSNTTQKEDTTFFKSIGSWFNDVWNWIKKIFGGKNG